MFTCLHLFWATVHDSTCIKDAGIAIRHSRERILFYTAGSKNGLEGVETVCPGTPKEVVPKKNTVFCYYNKKYVEDVKQNEKDAPDLLELLMRPSGTIKEKVRRILCKLREFISEITKMRVSSFWISENRWIPTGGQCQPAP